MQELLGKYKIAILSFFLILAILTVGLSILFFYSKRKGEKGFVILSPQQGQVFSPGAEVEVVVESAEPLEFLRVFVSRPFIVVFDRDAPYRIPFTLPNDLVGPVEIFISVKSVTGIKGGKIVKIDVQPSLENLIEITTSSDEISLFKPGDRQQVLVLGMFDGDRTVDLSAVSGIEIVSLNPRVARVLREIENRRVLVEGVDFGVGTVKVEGGGFTKDIRVEVGIHELQGDFDGDYDVDHNDLDILLNARNTPATGPGDPRDLNNDGMIDDADAKLLTALCSRLNCATLTGE